MFSRALGRQYMLINVITINITMMVMMMTTTMMTMLKMMTRMMMLYSALVHASCN